MNEILFQEMRSILPDLNLQLNFNFCDIAHMNHTDRLSMSKIFPCLWRPSICFANHGAFNQFVESFLFSYVSLTAVRVFHLKLRHRLQHF